VIRDPIACKPAILAETDDYVAMASEYQALSSLPGIEHAKDLGAGTGHPVHLGTRVSLRSAHMKTIDLSTATVRDLNQALHDQANNVEDREWVVTHSNGKHNLAVG
jgi:asparagine synthetase B (glutamine-hydrolysing)